MQYKIEPMTTDHRTAVVDIFNYYIEKSWAAFPDKAVPYGFFDRLFEITNGYPAVVVKDEADTVSGFAFLHSIHPETTLRKTAEITYFLMPNLVRKGIGTKILNIFMEQAKTLAIDNFLACISSLNFESIDFHIKNGFVECGRFKRVGRKFDRDFDLVWMQKRI